MLRIMDTLAGLVARRARVLASRREDASEKASATGPLIALETLGRPVWTPRDYQAFAREGFMQNAIVYRSVRMIAEAAASVPLLLYDGAEEIEEHPLLDLLRRPSPDHTGTDFLESWYGYLLVAGNAYVEAVALSGRLRELHVLRPDRMKVVPGEEGWPEAFEYTVAGQTVRFAEEPVRGVRPILHVRLFHPANDHYGMSPIEAAASAIDLYNTAARWNKALLDNSARPSGALVYGGADGRMTAEQFERLKLELEQGFQGAKQAGRPLLLEGGLDWKPLSLSPKDMDFIEAKNAAAREIALALGVPPMLLGIPGDNTFSNYQEANRSFWRHTVLPLVARTAKAISAWLAPAYGSALELRADLDQVEALSPEREALWARIERVTFLTLNEKRQAVGYTSLASLRDDPVEEPVVPPAPESDATVVIQKYRPDQSRAPAGQSDGGRWVEVGCGSGGLGSGSVASGVRAAAADDAGREDRVQVAQAGGNYGVDVTEEDRLHDGHTYERHIGKSDEYLKARIVGNRINIPGVGEGGLKRAGSFTSVEAANKLVNATISSPENVTKIEASVRRDLLYMLPVLYVRKTFDAVTGKEAHGPEGKGPDIRKTYSVEIRLVRSENSPKGFYVHSAYPFNPD
jgi:HK97 family phage portal protein